MLGVFHDSLCTSSVSLSMPNWIRITKSSLRAYFYFEHANGGVLISITSTSKEFKDDEDEKGWNGMRIEKNMKMKGIRYRRANNKALAIKIRSAFEEAHGFGSAQRGCR